MARAQEDGLGLSEEDRATLVEQVTVVMHVAASISFKEPLYEALQSNTLGTWRVWQLGQQCRQLRAFVHMSTAFVGCQFASTSIEVLMPEGCRSSARGFRSGRRGR